MTTKNFKRLLALTLATAMTLTACGQKPASNTSETPKTSESTPVQESEVSANNSVDPADLPTITMYPANGNLISGLITGYRGEVFAKHGFNLEVWAYSDDKTNVMLTSGDLPDVLYIGKGGMDTLTTLIETDKIINYDDYAEYLPHVLGDQVANEFITSNLDKSRTEFSAGTGGLYALPFGTGINSGIYAQTASFDRNVPKFNWRLYEAIGAPEVTDMWSLIDIAEQMVEYEPIDQDGTKRYATYLDNGLDSTSWGGMNLWYRWHGCNQDWVQYLVTANHADGTMTSIFEEDGVYKKGVKWYNELYRRGLMDPDSISTARMDQAPNIGNGYATLPSGTLPGDPTKYYEVFPSDLVVYRDYTNDSLTSVNNCLVINKETEHLEECLELVDMMADPYAWMELYHGPEGWVWQADGNVLSITDKFAEWLEEKGTITNFPMPDGTEFAIFNTTVLFSNGTPIPGYVDINGDPVSYLPTIWPDAQAITTNNDNWNAWKETMGADDLWDYCEKNNITVYQDSAFSNVTSPKPDESMQLTLSVLRDIIVPATWQMVYAETDEELEKLWTKMVEDCMTVGAQDIIDWMMENYMPAK